MEAFAYSIRNCHPTAISLMIRFYQLFMAIKKHGLACKPVDLIQLNRLMVITCKKLYKSKRGIANNQVNCLLFDKDNFLWLGTRDGLNKLIDTLKNGHTYFIQYKKSYSDQNSLSGNDISCTRIIKDLFG